MVVEQKCPIEARKEFHWYHHQLCVLSGIASTGEVVRIMTRLDGGVEDGPW